MHDCLADIRSELPGKPRHGVRPVAAERRAAFDLAKRCLRAVLHDKSISFLFEITAAVYLQTTAIIGCSLEIFHDNHRLEQFSAKRMGGKLGTVGYAEHVAGKSNNKKIEFRCLYQPLANVRVP